MKPRPHDPDPAMTRSDLFARLALVERIIRETPTIRLDHDRLELYAKLEHTNGVGTVKDRPAMWILKRAIERGDIVPGTKIVESSSGNFACALATFAAMLRLDFIPVIDPNVSPINEAYLRATCRTVVKVEDRDDTGGFLKTRLRTVQALLADHPGAYWPNQYDNADAAAAHYEMTGAEICRAVPAIDYVFVGVGSAGTIAGVSRRVKEMVPAARIIAVDVEGSVIFGQPPKRRYVPGIGSSISPGLLSQAIIDDLVIVSERDSVLACELLLRAFGLFVGGSTGSAYAAIESYFRDRPRTLPRPKVLFLCCDRGSAYVTSVFDPDWVANHLPAHPQANGSP
jgi:2,3-diaminopropionate biosynthesis protein SbnA